MRNPGVHWSEGMFLRPHHFQAADRYWSELISNQTQFDHPCGYGLLHVSISSEALASGTLELAGLLARWKDGTIISQDSNEVLRVELAESIDPKTVGIAPITVFLALPTLQLGQTNVAKGTLGGLERYVEFRRENDDESTGGNRQDIALRNLNFRILFSTQETTGFDLLPIARLSKSQTGDEQFRIDPSYFPPSIALSAWPDLAGIVRAIYDLIGSRIQSLGDIAREKGITLSSQSQGDLEKILLLHVLNDAYGELSCLAFAPGIHPLVAYTALCSIVGRCSLFGPEMTIEAVPRYDHDDLATIFRWALDRIRRLIYSVKEDEYEQRYFVGSGLGMLVNLEPEWFAAEWDWYFGVDPVNIGRDECYQLLKTQIDWKLGSADKVEEYMRLKKPGVTLRSTPQAPRALPSRGNWVYFQIVRENDAWKHVQVTQTMGMRVRQDQISNLDTLEGARRLRLSIAGKTYGLEFAVFAVRKRV